MFCKINSLSIEGLNVHPIDVEVDTGRGLPGMVIVGLPGKAIMESRDRVKTALTNATMPVPRARVTVNLAPGDLKKEGPFFDLPIALGVMICTEFLNPVFDINAYHLVGELSLDGRLRPVYGILNMAQHLASKNGKFIVPMENYREARLVEGLDVIPMSHLHHLMDFFSGRIQAGELIAKAEKLCPPLQPAQALDVDFLDVKGQPQAKRALTLAAAGGHNVLMLGPPGSGKSMLAERFPTILPPLNKDEALEVTRIYSVAGLLQRDHPLIEERPFRAPHHTISDVALIGGGADARPGEISLAHRGILFMDELPEFKRNTLEVLRQPLESGTITIGRARQVSKYPSAFILIAAMNPCPCGYHGSRVKNCRCTPLQIERYLAKLSGPLLDRIDIHLEVTDQSPAILRQSQQKGPDSRTLREKVYNARSIQTKRFIDTSVRCNSEMKGPMIDRYCPLEKESENFLIQGMEECGLSTRAYHKILLVARTIADMEGEDDIHLDHVAEALNYRLLDQKLFD